MDHEEVGGELVVPGRYASKVLEAAEHALYGIGAAIKHRMWIGAEKRPV